ncbi:glutamine synthetase-like [Eucyclogobius newberryi]|uniref:glutamine synthetase-like n=1 Tax=Eucyclogobius newberryi TaxID=166745 RepID=UPI003B5ABCC6
MGLIEQAARQDSLLAPTPNMINVHVLNVELESEYISAQVGLDRVYGRDVSNSHCNACLYAGIKLAGTTGEGAPGKWEFQVGPCEGLELGDHAWMARYILHRVCEDFGVIASFHPKPLKDRRWYNGGHMNFSTESMRAEGGIKHIHAAIERLAQRHAEHMEVYGTDENRKRLHGGGTNSDFNTFSWATAKRKCSVRIPGLVSQAGRGYLEDRRPAADCDPYLVCKALVQTCLLPPSVETLEEQMSENTV